MKSPLKQVPHVPLSPAIAPRPVLKRRRWPYLLAWLAPLAALAVGGLYARDYYANLGPKITLRMSSAEGFRPGETLVQYRGVPIGRVSGLKLSPDHRHALVDVQLGQGVEDFAREGAAFWVVRPQISGNGLVGFGTLLSGPYVDSLPGHGAAAKVFATRAQAPEDFAPGIDLRIHAPELQNFQAHAPIYYRGVQVGEVRDLQLGSRADRVEARILIWKAYAPLVRTGTKFWSVSAFDFKAGLFSGVKVKLESPKTLITGALAFATPDKDMGEPVAENADFELQAEAPDDWVKWSPKIPIRPAKAVAQP